MQLIPTSPNNRLSSLKVGVIKQSLDVIITSMFVPRAKYKLQESVAAIYRCIEDDDVEDEAKIEKDSVKNSSKEEGEEKSSKEGDKIENGDNEIIKKLNINKLKEKKREIERFYFVYRICQLCRDGTQAQTDKLLKLLFPMPLSKSAHIAISQLIALALSFPSHSSQVLDSMSTYLNSSETIEICVDSWARAYSLARDSPAFCSALVSNFSTKSLHVPLECLTNWLQDLSSCSSSRFADKDYPNLQHVIRYSLNAYDECIDEQTIINEHNINDKTSLSSASKTSSKHQPKEFQESDLHLAILNVIENRRCRPLSNQFLIDVATTLAKQHIAKQFNANLRIDRFAMILSVAAFSKITTISNALKNALSKLGSSQLIEAVMQIQNR